MDHDVVEKCIRSCVDTFLDVVKIESDILQVLDMAVDEVFLVFAFKGFEINAMGESGHVAGWTPSMFGEAINVLIAELYGAGTRVTSLQWFQTTQKALEAISRQGYTQHPTITPDIIRAWIRK